MEALAFTKKQILEQGLVPWGRTQLEHDLADGTCPSFRRGRRRYISADQLQQYIENLKEQ